MKYKLVAIDMDGTLLNSRNEVSMRTIETLRAVRAKGVETVIATGRLFKSASYYADFLGFSNSIITSNGALMADERGNILYEKSLNRETIEIIEELSNKYDIYNHFYSKDKFYSKIESREILKFYDEGDQKNKIDLRVYRDLNEILNNRNINIHKCLYVENKDKEKLKALNNELKSVSGINITSSWSNNIEVMGEGVSKGNALEELCRIKNIDPEQVIAIGDNKNDLSMLNYSGYSIAMGNALEEVKSQVDHVTLSNDEDGLALALEKIIL